MCRAGSYCAVFSEPWESGAGEARAGGRLPAAANGALMPLHGCKTVACASAAEVWICKERLPCHRPGGKHGNRRGGMPAPGSFRMLARCGSKRGGKKQNLALPRRNAREPSARRRTPNLVRKDRGPPNFFNDFPIGKSPPWQTLGDFLAGENHLLRACTLRRASAACHPRVSRCLPPTNGLKSFPLSTVPWPYPHPTGGVCILSHRLHILAPAAKRAAPVLRWQLRAFFAGHRGCLPLFDNQPSRRALFPAGSPPA